MHVSRMHLRNSVEKLVFPYKRWLVLPRYSRTRLRLASIAWYRNNYFAATNSKLEILDMRT